jgi:hypothetical protein
MGDGRRLRLYCSISIARWCRFLIHSIVTQLESDRENQNQNGNCNQESAGQESCEEDGEGFEPTAGRHRKEGHQESYGKIEDNALTERVKR